MTTSNEVLKAAARLRNDAYHSTGKVYDFVQRDKDRCLLGDYALTLLPSDGDELVTVDWIEGLSSEGGDMSFLAVRLVGNHFHLVGHGDYVAPKPATRQDVRSICAAFGREAERIDPLARKVKR